MNCNHTDAEVEIDGVGWCFILYQKHFGVKYYPLRTQDIDFLISISYKGKKKLDLISAIESLGFKTGFRTDGSIYLWNSELKYVISKRMEKKNIFNT